MAVGFSSSHRKSRWRVAAIAVGLLVGGAVVAWQVWERREVRAERLLIAAVDARATRDHPSAERLATRALSLNPALAEAALVAAEAAAAQGEFRRAVDLIERATFADPRQRLRAALLVAECHHHHLYRLTEAERAYRAALQLAPDHVGANTGLAKLLCLCGRKREAVPLILRLIKLNEETDLLVVLAKSDVVVDDPEALEQARQAAPRDPNVLLGLAWHAAQQERFDEAIALLKDVLRQQPGHVAAHIALGQQLLAARRFDELAEWTRHIPRAADEYGDTWLVRAQLSEHDRDAPGAIRCYWEAARRAPESKAANYQLARLLTESGRTDLASRFSERVRQLQELEGVQNPVIFTPDSFEARSLWELVQGCEVAGRLWEAYGWCRYTVRLDGNRPQGRHYLEQLTNAVRGLPLQLTVDSANAARSVDLSNYPMPRFHQHRLPKSSETAEVASFRLSFQDDAATAGLAFRYFAGVNGPFTHRMFEFTGGGVGVLDFDLDGWPDAYFSQGRTWPLETADSDHGDRLFRNRDGVRFIDVTTAAGIVEAGFGQGVTVGDFNADGFPDVYVANIGTNLLWKNNGDGTFTDVTQEAGVDGAVWTTSCALVDLTGDGLPDIYDVNYLMGQDVFDRVCRILVRLPRLCMPSDFDSQPDRFWRNEGDGRFRDATVETLGLEPGGMGLGVAVWDEHGTGRLSLLVANDTNGNFYFANETSGEGPARFRECGVETGLALNGEGKATGCMGVALGDVDDDGRMDVFITNFFNEPNTLYLNRTAGVFEDRTRELGLHAPSIHMLGFGTQFFDADLDGRVELFVANGHVDDVSRFGRPYRMPAQLFRGDGRTGFGEVNAGELGPYFQQEWLGRAVARLDWNRDGRDDLIVGHLQDDSALLTNTTPVFGGFLSLRLFGVQSNRDAIGTTIRARVGKRTIVRQLTAGDGYQASNERRIIIGTGSAEQIDELEVRWPSGTVQRFSKVSASQEALLREGGPLYSSSTHH